jgi:DNA polymerase-3 subunit delta'
MIFGHNQQKEILENIFRIYENGGFLLFGPEGIGKFSLIKEVVKDKAAGENLIVIDKKSVVKDTMDLIKNLAMYRSDGNRIIIINDAHTINIYGQNLLLKILEEIPSKTFFFFVSHRPQKILATIRSRLHPIKFRLVEENFIKNWLGSQRGSEIKTAMNIFQGQPGLALRAILEKEKFNLLAKFIQEKNQFSKMLLAEKITKQMELDEFLKYLIFFERINLRKNSKEALLRLKNLLSLYFDSGYYLNKNLHIKNICLNYY